MAWLQVLHCYELLDTARVTAVQVQDLLESGGVPEVTVAREEGPRGGTDFIRAVLPGSRGKRIGGDAPTLGIVGRHGGIGARPHRIGYVSDGDGALAALSCALKLGTMRAGGDILPGDVIVTTHICPTALVQPRDPVPFMMSPVDMAVMNRHEVDAAMEAILCLDTTRGNRIINHKGFAISPTVKEGYILRISEDLLRLMEYVTGLPPVVFAITHQDITPYSNGLHHLNSILQPSTVSPAPTVGVALTTVTAVPGAATGAAQLADVEAAVRFCIEVAKALTAAECRFYDEAEFKHLFQLYGPMTRLQRPGEPP